MSLPIRILTAVPICDGHDSAINTINLEFIRHGIEVIYLGYHRPVVDIVRAAIQEDVRAIGISSYNGGHVEFFAAVVDLLRKKGADDIKVFGGGGGTITHDDAAAMRRKGIDEIFFAGTSLDDMVKFVHRRYGKPRAKRPRPKSFDQELAHELSEIEEAYGTGKRKRRMPDGGRRSQRIKIANRKSQTANPKVIGFTGPGGAGKTTLIDELVLRFLHANPKDRIAILSHDPSVIGEGALLGDRATMINSQDGYPGTGGRTFACNARLPRVAGAVEFRLRHYRDRRNGTGGDAISEKRDRQFNRAGDESRLRQPVTIAKDRHARSRRYRGGEQERSSARAHSTHGNRAASRTKSTWSP